jgi:hypothetical protein
MKIYFARPISQYGTFQDNRDIALLEKMGFEVINPAKTEDVKEDYKKRGMPAYTDSVATADALAFRSFIDLKIGAGVSAEINKAIELNLPVFELPTITQQRILSVEETREYLSYIGQR